MSVRLCGYCDTPIYGGPVRTDTASFVHAHCVVHTEPNDAAVDAYLAAALPDHPLMADWAAERDIWAQYRRFGGEIFPATLSRTVQTTT